MSRSPVSYIMWHVVIGRRHILPCCPNCVALCCCLAQPHGDPTKGPHLQSTGDDPTQQKAPTYSQQEMTRPNKRPPPTVNRSWPNPTSPRPSKRPLPTVKRSWPNPTSPRLSIRPPPTVNRNWPDPISPRPSKSPPLDCQQDPSTWPYHYLARDPCPTTSRIPLPQAQGRLPTAPSPNGETAISTAVTGTPWPSPLLKGLPCGPVRSPQRWADPSPHPDGLWKQRRGQQTCEKSNICPWCISNLTVSALRQESSKHLMTESAFNTGPNHERIKFHLWH